MITCFFVVVLFTCFLISRAANIPTATNVSITGTPDVGETLTGNYTYSSGTGNWEIVGTAGFSSTGEI